jgi:hypothetical protein
MIKALDYFNLNSRAARSIAIMKSKRIPKKKAMKEKATRKQVLRQGETARPSSQQRAVSVRKMSFWEQLLLYVGLVIGVIFSSYVMQFKSGETIHLNITVTTALISAVIALIITPFVFEKLSVRPESPLLVRFGLFVQHGVFWQVVFGLIGKAMAG